MFTFASLCSDIEFEILVTLQNHDNFFHLDKCFRNNNTDLCNTCSCNIALNRYIILHWNLCVEITD